MKDRQLRVQLQSRPPVRVAVVGLGLLLSTPLARWWTSDPTGGTTRVPAHLTHPGGMAGRGASTPSAQLVSVAGRQPDPYRVPELCAAWNCSCQAFSDTFNAQARISNFGMARDRPKARQWWLDQNCNTDPTDRRPVLELLVHETDGCIEPRERV